jgi:CheY-like chemotaxis protein
MIILVVDDERQYRLLLRDLLQDEGHTVLEAADGQEALEKLGRTTPDVIISDVYMPVMDGLKFHRAVRSDPQHATLPFLFVSAYDDEHTRDAVKDPRYEGFLRKGKPVGLLKDWIVFLSTPPEQRSGLPPTEARSRLRDL